YIGVTLNNPSGHLPSNMGNFLPNLQQLYLGANQLSGIIPSSISNSSLLIELDNLRFLRLLNLASNNLAIESYTLESSFFSTLSNFRYLKMLLFSNNPLNGIFPSSVRNLSISLKYFGIGHCSINGNIPREIGNLSNLMTLLLDNNQFVGPIPTTLGKLHKLEALYLENNKLEGSIPPDLCNLENLIESNLASNELTGGVNFSSNLLDGSLPMETGNMKVLRILYLSRNQLSGDIPTTIGGLKDLVNLSLAYDQLEGSISEACLEFLDLTNNKLSSEIPKSLKALLYLKYLNVTQRFSLNNLLGEWSFGSVYKGTLSNGMNGQLKSFDVECKVLRNTLHRNLTKIICICSNIEFNALVLEYIPNGNLEKWLYSHNHYLNILQIINIMEDVASAVEYLHYGYLTTIVYCDLQPSNILLDEDWVAHVANFGMAKLLGDGDSMMRTMTLATIGYMTTEYGWEGIISTRGYVYSYGILLMETFTRKRPTDDIFSEDMSLRSWIEESLLVFSVTDIIDDNLLSNRSDDASMEELISSIMRLALDCCVESLEQRINIKNVSGTLRKIKLKFLQHHTDQGN
ncbi:hypothetical protein I3842_09G133900, partial [Carya illinoinensis]